MFTDKNLEAEYRYKFRQYKLVIDEMPETKTFEHIITHCDQWSDYARQRYKHLEEDDQSTDADSYVIDLLLRRYMENYTLNL